MKTENFSETRVILLSGEEFQRLERMSEILDATVDEATRDFNLDVLYTDDFEKKTNEFLTKLSELIMTFPMMTQRRVIIIRDFDKLNKDVIKKACEVIKQTPETALVIVEGDKASLLPRPKNYFIAEQFKQIYENNLPDWIKDRFKKRGKNVSESAVALLINNAGTILRELDSEIEKVTIIVGDRDSVSEDDVKQVVGSFKRDTIWGLCNAIGLEDFKEATRILNNLMEKEKTVDDKKITETYIIWNLSSHLMKISEYNRLKKRGVPHDEAMQVVTTKKFLWNLNKMNAQIRNLNPHRIRRILTVLGRTESTLKRSRIDKKLLLEFLIPLIMPREQKE
ncbi:DNA polymerase III subunit delta [Candidatus Latescibacterota bacterium]